MEHNGRNVMEKLYQRLRGKEGTENFLKELDRLDQGKQGLTMDMVSDLAEDIAKFFPDDYASVPEAAALVVHVKQEREKKAKEIKDAGTPNP
mgnify:FL=1